MADVDYKHYKTSYKSKSGLLVAMHHAGVIIGDKVFKLSASSKTDSHTQKDVNLFIKSKNKTWNFELVKNDKGQEVGKNGATATDFLKAKAELQLVRDDGAEDSSDAIRSLAAYGVAQGSLEELDKQISELQSKRRKLAGAIKDFETFRDELKAELEREAKAK
jgi:hypothetical protein